MASLVPWTGGRSVFDPFTSDIWDPFVTNSGWLWPSTRRADDASAIVPTNIDWRETDTAHIITAEIPGVRKDEMRVEVEEGNVLRISGERMREEEVSTDTWHRLERHRGSFVRRFRLPDNANVDEIECSLEHGVLTVTIPKKTTGYPRANIRTIDIA